MKALKNTNQESKAAEAANKKINSSIKKLTTRIKKLCKDPKVGLSVIKIQLEYIRENNTRLPDESLNKAQTVSAFQDAIRHYLEELQNPKEKKKRVKKIKKAA